jgi:hypothetical protein
VQEQDVKYPTPDKWGGADLRDNEKDSGSAGSNAAKRPKPAQLAEMNKRPKPDNWDTMNRNQRKHWKIKNRFQELEGVAGIIPNL